MSSGLVHRPRSLRSITRTFPQLGTSSGDTLNRSYAPSGRWLGVTVLDWWRAGCPAGLSWRAGALALPAWLLSAAAITGTTTRESFVAWLLLSLAGSLTAGILLLLLAPIAKRLVGLPGAAAVVLVWALAGIAGLVLQLWLASITEIDHPEMTPSVLVTAVAFMWAWLPIGGRISSAIRLDRSTRAVLLRQLARERALALESARLVESDRNRVLEQTARVVSEQLLKATELSSDPDAAAAALQDVVDEVLRPLSHELARGEVHEQTLVETVHTMGAASPRPLSDFLPVLRNPSIGLLGITIVRPIIVLAIIVSATGQMIPLGNSWLWLALLAVYSCAISASYLLAEARTTSSLRELSLAVDAAEWAAARLRQLAWSERERLGQSIHGEAQARIVATALSIQLGRSEEVEEQLAMLSDDIHELLVTSHYETDWRAVWSRILQVWEYSIEIHQDIDESTARRLDADSVAAHAVVSVLREGATNAVRHGKARCLDIQLSTDVRDRIHLAMVDDGTQGANPGTPGMGSHTMDAVCMDWMLITTPTGHRLDARIPTIQEGDHGRR